jgi:hypothetical protein
MPFPRSSEEMDAAWRNAFNLLMDRQLGPQLLELVSLNRRFGREAFPTI